MPVARIVSRYSSPESEGLKALSEQLRAAGYEVVVAPPGTEGVAADLVVELDELSASEALEAAVRLARESEADVFIAPGLFTHPASSPEPVTRTSQRSADPVVETVGDVPFTMERGGIIGSTLEDLGAALSEGRMGVRDALTGVRARGASAWARWQQQRAEAAQALRLARERREMELEERRRQHEAELQRRAEEHQQLLAERERLAAEQERVLREQMARDAALRAERDRAQREAMAREAARRAEIAHAEEQERRRMAAIEADRMRAVREQEAQRAAALAAERIRLQREQAERLSLQRQEETRRLAAETRQVRPELLPADNPAAPHVSPGLGDVGSRLPAETYPPAFEPIYADAVPVLRPTPLRPRRLISSRERQWQRAALLASIVTLAAMIGFALAGSVHHTPPIPAAVIQNGAQQQVPFGPAKMDFTSVGKPAFAPAAPLRRAVKQAGGAGNQPAPALATPSRKPSPAKPAPRRARRLSRESEFVADDEVVVRHIPTSAASSKMQRAQTTAGVRRYSDED